MAAPHTPPVTVLTVDDQAVFLGAARALITAAAGFECVGQAVSGPEALRVAADLHPDLVLIDLRMPGMDGIETARRLHQSEPDAVLVLISLEDVPLAASIAAAGVNAHLRKQELSERTLRDVWAAHGGP